MKTTLRLYIDEAHTALNIFPCASNTTFVVLVMVEEKDIEAMLLDIEAMLQDIEAMLQDIEAMLHDIEAML